MSVFDGDPVHNDVVSTMDRIRAMRGLPPINSTSIDGTPDPRSFSQEPGDSPNFDPVPLDEVLEAPPPAPMAQLAKPRPAPPTITPSEVRIAVMDALASFEGHAVELSPAEQNAVAKIILEASISRAKESLDRMAKPPLPAVVTPEAPVKRKRGRPRKNPVAQI